MNFLKSMLKNSAIVILLMCAALALVLPTTFLLVNGQFVAGIITLVLSLALVISLLERQ